MHSDVYEPVWLLKTWYNDRSMILNSVFWHWSEWLWPWLKVRQMEKKAQTSAPIIWKLVINLDRIWYTVLLPVPLCRTRPFSVVVLVVACMRERRSRKENCKSHGGDCSFKVLLLKPVGLTIFFFLIQLIFKGKNPAGMSLPSPWITLTFIITVEHV